MRFAAAPADVQAPEVRVFITGGERAGQYAHAVELTEQGFVTVRVREGGHIVVDPNDLRPATDDIQLCRCEICGTFFRCQSGTETNCGNHGRV